MSPTDSANTACESRDLLSSPWRAVLLFWLPGVAFVLAGTPAFTPTWRTIVWCIALGTMGTACVVNARRCGRVHCYLTGPFFLLMALVTLFYGLGVLPLGRSGWSFIGSAVLLGAILLCRVPEMLFGKYRPRRT